MKRAIIAIAAAALVVLAGCSASAGDAKARPAKSPSYASAPSTVASATKAAPMPKTNERGNLPKAIGEQGLLFNTETNTNYFTFTVNSITPNYQCGTGYSEPPKNGQYLAINMTVTGGPAIAEVGGSVQVTPHDFQIIGLDGVAENGIQNGGTYGCVPDGEAFPMQGVGQGVTGTGTVVLDTKNASGYLVFHPAISGGPAGWEYKF